MSNRELNLPYFKIYIHGHGMKELAERFDDIQPTAVLKYDYRSYKLRIASIEKRSKVSTPEQPCLEKEENPGYEPAQVRSLKLRSNKRSQQNLF